MILYTMKIITVLLQYYITGMWFINQMVPKHILKLEYIHVWENCFHSRDNGWCTIMMCKIPLSSAKTFQKSVVQRLL